MRTNASPLQAVATRSPLSPMDPDDSCIWLLCWRRLFLLGDISSYFGCRLAVRSGLASRVWSRVWWLGRTRRARSVWLASIPTRPETCTHSLAFTAWLCGGEPGALRLLIACRMRLRVPSAWHLCRRARAGHVLYLGVRVGFYRRSKRSRFMTLSQAVTKSRANFSFASSEA